MGHGVVFSYEYEMKQISHLSAIRNDFKAWHKPELKSARLLNARAQETSALRPHEIKSILLFTQTLVRAVWKLEKQMPQASSTTDGCKSSLLNDRFFFRLHSSRTHSTGSMSSYMVLCRLKHSWCFIKGSSGSAYWFLGPFSYDMFFFKYCVSAKHCIDCNERGHLWTAYPSY